MFGERSLHEPMKRVPVLVAPMMDWTDRHCRYFLRLLSPGAMLYTEMVTAEAILHGERQRLIVQRVDVATETAARIPAPGAERQPSCRP